MVDQLMSRLDSLGAKRLDEAAAIVVEELISGSGVRIGDSSVLSTKVHSFNAQTPEHVQIMDGADAGRVFYQRQDSGRVAHLDVFHQCGRVDHRIAAQYIRLAVAVYEQCSGGSVNPCLMDIQTATGGGRITGKLEGGNKQSLRRAHENHVHLAFSLPVSEYCCIFYIVAAIETAIEQLGLQLRRNERISYIETAESPEDLCPYTDESDSLLKGPMPASAAEVDAAITSNSPLRCTQSTAEGSSTPGVSSGQTLTAIKDKMTEEPIIYEKVDSKSSTLTHPLCAPGLECCVKQALMKLKSNNCCSRKEYIRSQVKTAADDRSGRKNGGSSTLDLSATISAAARRLIGETGCGRLVIHAADLRFYTCRQRRGYDICLVTDTSASMGGDRLKAAKFLAGKVAK